MHIATKINLPLRMNRCMPSNSRETNSGIPYNYNFIANNNNNNNVYVSAPLLIIMRIPMENKTGSVQNMK